MVGKLTAFAAVPGPARHVGEPLGQSKTYRRGDDESLFDCYHGLYDSEEAVKAIVARERKEFPSCSNPDLVLRISHIRTLIN